MGVEFRASEQNYWVDDVVAPPTGVPLSFMCLFSQPLPRVESELICIKDRDDDDNVFELFVRGNGVVRARSSETAGANFASSIPAIDADTVGLASCTFTSETPGMRVYLNGTNEDTGPVRTPTGLDVVAIGAQVDHSTLPKYADVDMYGAAIFAADLPAAAHAAAWTACQAGGIGFLEWCLNGDGTYNFGPNGTCELVRFVSFTLGKPASMSLLNNNAKKDWITSEEYKVFGPTGEGSGTFTAIADPPEITRSFRTLAAIPASFHDRLDFVLTNRDEPDLMPTGFLKADGGPLEMGRRILGYFETVPNPYSDSATEAQNIYDKYIDWAADPAGDGTVAAIDPNDGHLVLQNWGRDGMADGPTSGEPEVWNEAVENDPPGVTGKVDGDPDGGPYTGNADHGAAVILALKNLFVTNGTMPRSFTFEELNIGSNPAQDTTRDRWWRGKDGDGGVRQYLFDCCGGNTIAAQFSFFPGLESLGAYSIRRPFESGTLFGNTMQQILTMRFQQVTADTGTSGATLVIEERFPNTVGVPDYTFDGIGQFNAASVGRHLLGYATGIVYEITKVNDSMSVDVSPSLDAADAVVGSSEFSYIGPPSEFVLGMWAGLRAQGRERWRPQLTVGNPYPLMFIPDWYEEHMQAVVGDVPEAIEIMLHVQNVEDGHATAMYEHMSYYLDPDSSGIVYQTAAAGASAPAGHRNRWIVPDRRPHHLLGRT